MERQRVVITGLGTVNPLDNNVVSTWEKALKGESGIGLITRFDPSNFKTRFAGEVKGLDVSLYIEPKAAKRMDPFTVFGVCAAEQAISDAGIDFSQFTPEDIGVIMGVGMGGILTFEDQHSALINKGPGRVSPFFVPMLIPDIVCGHIAMRHNLKGDNYSISSACASSAHAIGESYWSIATGRQRMIITGGAEAAVAPMALAGFNSAQALSTRNDDYQHASRPFDLNRDGFIMAEGSAIIVLEELSSALKRGAKIYAEIVGMGYSCDAFHITSPDPEGKGAILAMQKALKSAGLEPHQIGHINAHGTSTELNDKTETGAIKQVFGDHAYQLVVCSTKSMTGHLLGSAGAIETLFLAKSLQEQVIPPTINYQTPDPSCDLNYNPNQASSLSFEYGLTNSFGFGGHNCSLILKRYAE